MVKASEFVRGVVASYERGDGYIWGTYGQVWNETLQRKGSRQNNRQTQQYGRRWLDHRVYDCSGLPYSTAKGLGLQLPHGTNSIWKRCMGEKGPLASFPPERRLPGMAVFLTRGIDRHHMGTYIGGGWVIEAKGARFGVVLSRWEDWDEAGFYRDMDYDLDAGFVPEFVFSQSPPPRGFHTVRRDDAGPDVRYVQVLLRVRHGMAVIVDNQFGAAMLAQVRAFQQAHGLAADGVVGPLTIAALEQEADHE